MNAEYLKKLAAEKSVEEISSGMIVGLGSGSTVQYALEKISEKIKNGDLKNIRCIPSSNHTEAEANRLGIPIITFDELLVSGNASTQLGTDVKRETGEEGTNRSNPVTPHVSSFTLIDITIDGADEVTLNYPQKTEGSNKINLIKGGGGALLREKVLAQASKKFIVIIDESKISKYLGTNWQIPIEVIPFAVSVETKYMESLGAKVARRKKADGSDYITDENNFILDAYFGEIKNPEELSVLLNQRAGIVEHGLFIGLATKLICAMRDGEINVTKRKERGDK